MFPWLLKGCFVFWLSYVRTKHGVSELWFACSSKNYTCLTERRGTYMKYLPLNHGFFSHLPLMISPSWISHFRLLLCLPRAISQISLGDNAAGVTIHLFHNCSRRGVSTYAHLEGRRNAHAHAVYFCNKNLTAPCDLSFPKLRPCSLRR